MAQSDLNVLLDMGFEKERAEIAVKKTGGLQGALQWLEDSQDKSIEHITAAAKDDIADEDNPTIEPVPLEDGEVAQSLVCDDCGKRFRSVNQAQAHGERTSHENFSESTEEIAPLTDAEKKEKLEELRRLAAERKAKQALVDKEEHKKNEKIRMKSTKDVQDIMENMAKKEQIKAAADKRKEKQADALAKQKIKDKIAADKEERRLKVEKVKAEREGRAVAEPVAAPAPVASSSGPRPAATECRLRLQAPHGTFQKTFPVDTTLFEVAQAVEAEGGAHIESLTMTYPKKTFSGSVDFGKTLKEAGLVPSAVLIVK
ncbi:ubiquitin-related domain-containing protein [Calycina marina]|uniref:Ubiquitin-related domain-containing protein n=1 Tax=Calycina marina TaxID=1763456 RepID=A0A9P7Z517_9HELO|nr:ubiquitin-related domain-containing protein [Calycina marina]